MDARGRNAFGFVLIFPSYMCPLVSNVGTSVSNIGTVVDACVHARALQMSLTARALVKRYNNISINNYAHRFVELMLCQRSCIPIHTHVPC